MNMGIQSYDPNGVQVLVRFLLDRNGVAQNRLEWTSVQGGVAPARPPAENQLYSRECLRLKPDDIRRLVLALNKAKYGPTPGPVAVVLPATVCNEGTLTAYPTGLVTAQVDGRVCRSVVLITGLTINEDRPALTVLDPETVRIGREKPTARNLRLTERSQQYLDVIERSPDGLTSHEIAEKFGDPINSVTGRIAELHHMGLLQSDGRVPRGIKGAMVSKWVRVRL